MLESWVRFSVLLSIGVAVLTLALTAFLLLRAFDRDSSLRKLSGQQIQDGVRLDAELLSIRQTGLLVNQKPMMRLELKVSRDGFSRELTIEQLIDLGICRAPASAWKSWWTVKTPPAPAICGRRRRCGVPDGGSGPWACADAAPGVAAIPPAARKSPAMRACPSPVAASRCGGAAWANNMVSFSSALIESSPPWACVCKRALMRRRLSDTSMESVTALFSRISCAICR